MCLPEILGAEAKAGIRSSHKAVIMIYLPGGIPHQDMWDMKPDAPQDVRGEFKPIKTNVPGIEICEHMPKLAAMMDKFAIIRSLVGARDEHAGSICWSGYTLQETNQNKAPSLGAVLSRMQGPVDKAVPAYVGLSGKAGHTPWADPGTPGFLGMAHAPFKPDGQLMQDITLKDITLDRIADRKRMLQSVDRFRRNLDLVRESDTIKGMDATTARAFDMLTGSKLVHALDVTKEDPKIRARYGKGRETPVDDGLPMINDHFLAARRLVEAGVRCVTLGYGRWDYHGANFTQLKSYLPMLDSALTALVSDIHDRGLDKDVSVVVWSEFGRTPRVNKDAGRDHWPKVSSALVAGGGMKTAQVIGSTTRFAEEADDRPVHYRDVFMSLYRNLGINPHETAIPDVTNRPNYLYDGHEPVHELH